MVKKEAEETRTIRKTRTEEEELELLKRIEKLPVLEITGNPPE